MVTYELASHKVVVHYDYNIIGSVYVSQLL